MTHISAYYNGCIKISKIKTTGFTKTIIDCWILVLVLLSEIALAVQTILPTVTHFSVAWSIRPSFCLSSVASVYHA